MSTATVLPMAAEDQSSSSFSALKDRIKSHYDVCSSYYLNLWGQHIHHGYWTEETDTITKELAQVHLIELLLARAGYGSSPTVASELGLPSFITNSISPEVAAHPSALNVLDVGCGVGGTTRYLAEKRGWNVTGVTISSEQIKIAYDLTRKAVASAELTSTEVEIATNQDDGSRIKLGELGGSVQYIQLDAEQISPRFPSNTYDLILITEALSHLPQKSLFYQNCSKLLKPGGKLIVADWLKKSGMTTADQGYKEDVEKIEEGMLLPPLEDMEGYYRMAKEAGLIVRKGGEGIDISDNVKRTWDISLSLIQSPSLWAFAFSQGRDFVAFLKAFQAMRRGFGNGNFRYGVVVFEKPV